MDLILFCLSTSIYFVGQINGHYEDVEDEPEIEPLETGKPGKPANCPRRADSVDIPETGDEEEVMKDEASSCQSCNCQRPIASIRCSAQCSFTLLGRLSLLCPAHPGRLHLMDHQPDCPDCGQRLGKLLSFNKVLSNLPSNFLYPKLGNFN